MKSASFLHHMQLHLTKHYLKQYYSKAISSPLGNKFLPFYTCHLKAVLDTTAEARAIGAGSAQGKLAPPLPLTPRDTETKA